jgi:hypothetical protein
MVTAVSIQGVYVYRTVEHFGQDRQVVDIKT